MGRRKVTEEAPFRQFPPAPLPPSPYFRKIVKFAGLPVQATMRGRGSGLITVPRPLRRFDSYPRWPPVTQSARSPRSYGKIGASAQANPLPRHLLPKFTYFKREMSELEAVHNQHHYYFQPF